MIKEKYFICLLCLYAFSKYFRPAESFLTPFLTSESKNFTNKQLTEEIYPIWTYSYLVCTIPIFLLADLCRYKILIVLEIVCHLFAWILLSWGSSLWYVQVAEILYGFATASEVAFYAFMYARLDNKYYKQATAYVKSSVMLGKFVSCMLGQWLITGIVVDYQILNFITLGSLNFAFIFALMLFAEPLYPSAESREKSVAVVDDVCKEFIRSEELLERELNLIEGTPPKNENKAGVYFTNLRRKFIASYSNINVLQWSIWWALAQAGVFQVVNYVQNLWKISQHDQSEVYNGFTQGATTLLGSIVVFSIQCVKSPMVKYGESSLSISSGLACICIIVMSQTSVLVLSYACYCLFRTFNQVVVAFIMYNLAKQLPKDSCGLIFGFNTFMAVFIQTILTILLMDKVGLAVNIKNQFLIYGCYYGVIGLLFLIIGLRRHCF